MHILASSISDHKPLKQELLAHLDLGPIPFRFSPLWVKEPYFMQTFKDCWSQHVKGSPFFIREEKLRRARKCFNTISEIKEDNDIHKDFEDIKKVAFSHFQNLYSEDKDPHQYSDLLDIIPSAISPRMNEILEVKVTKDEVKKALFDMDPDKAPGLDGFSARFLQVCWPIVEKHLLKMVQKSQNT
eukprot:PITA_28169